jgi:tropomodulin
MMNQDQYHASLLSKGQPIGLGWDGITKASQPKPYPADPPNMTDPDTTIKQVQDDDQTLIDLNWTNIKVIIRILHRCCLSKNARLKIYRTIIVTFCFI